MKSVLFFGTFDPLHEGHRNAFASAKALGDHLIVVVARDTVLSAEKRRKPYLHEDDRLSIVAADGCVDEAIFGDSHARSYGVLQKISFDILALGYDQEPSDEQVAAILESNGLSHVHTVRLPAFSPDRYKSSLLRSS